ncbi:galactose mutarotase [Paraglaciecola aquimarina]|uniref:Aldose 1-epimerase n=1 Tax=Paraglaciecola algarum TaxID=3050085 RepID=A0ABS9D756_9ALTE|nr:aldose epimerase family protein [Paraglaciecola sp. G1-23]MCF2948610.1 galactose mutarotase [Paraglaciecola sp. G1-23]
MIKKQNFGTLSNGQNVEQYTLTNENGVSADILTLGGILRRFHVPTKLQSTDIVLGFDTLEEYVNDQSYLGTLVGRYANRINQGKFSLNGADYQVDVNQNGNCLHGGANGFNSYVWQATVLPDSNAPSLALEMLSHDGDQGFPGNIEVKAIYSLTHQNRLKIEYFARSDQDTIFNPTNHAYFNLAGQNSGDVTQHKISIEAGRYTPTDSNAIPTGELATVDATPFDFRTPTTIADVLALTHQQLEYGNGLDHNLCLDHFISEQKDALYAGNAICAESGIEMKVYTSMPGMQIFTANHFADMPGKDGAIYQAHQGVCFESQFYPDTPNHGNFPSAELKANQDFYSVTEYEVIF